MTFADVFRDAALIPGWFTQEESAAIYAVAQSLPERSKLVEIGSWMGRSSVVIGSAIRDMRSKLYCIDPFNSETTLVNNRDTINEFKINIAAAGLKDIVEPIKGYSHEVAMKWDDDIDFLFIDGNHQYAFVKTDLQLWAPFLKPGAVLALHDVFTPDESEMPGYEAGPWRAYNELIGGQYVRVGSLLLTKTPY